MSLPELVLSDAHAHLESYDPEALDDLIDRGKASGVCTIIANGITLRSSTASVEIAGRYSFIWATVGLHPFYAPRLLNAVGAIRELAKNIRVVGIGEIGLDFVRHPETRELQISLFDEQLNLALELDMPVIIHTKAAHRETLEAVKKAGIPEKCAIMQGFRDNLSTMEDWLECGFYLSIGGTILREPTDSLAEAIRQIPSERLLLETDTSARRTLSQGLELTTLKIIAEKVAELRGVSVEEIAAITTRNLREALRLSEN